MGGAGSPPSDLLGGIQEMAFESVPQGGLLCTQFWKRRLRKQKETRSWLPGVTFGDLRRAL